jgi:hypothetical protein
MVTETHLSANGHGLTGSATACAATIITAVSVATEGNKPMLQDVQHASVRALCALNSLEQDQCGLRHFPSLTGSLIPRHDGSSLRSGGRGGRGPRH